MIPENIPKKLFFPVLGATPRVIGCLQAMETIKLITEMGEPLVGRMLILNSMNMSSDEIKIDRDPNCRVCGRQTR